MKVSVCIPVYNQEKYIQKAIDSVLDQDFEDFELLIIDNKSTDRTLEIIEDSFQKNPNKIRIIKNTENIGMQNNWNKCLDNASGEYIKILPSDDFLYPKCLSEQVKILDNNSQVSLVCSKRNIVDENEKVVFNRGFFNFEGEINGKEAMKKTIRAGGNYIGEPGAVLFRKSISIEAGYFSARFFYVIDMDYWYRLLLLGNLYAIQTPLAAFRISKESLSVLTKKSQARDYSNWCQYLFGDKKLDLKKYDVLSGIIRSRISQYIKRVIYWLIL